MLTLAHKHEVKEKEGGKEGRKKKKHLRLAFPDREKNIVISENHEKKNRHPSSPSQTLTTTTNRASLTPPSSKHSALTAMSARSKT